MLTRVRGGGGWSASASCWRRQVTDGSISPCTARMTPPFASTATENFGALACAGMAPASPGARLRCKWLPPVYAVGGMVRPRPSDDGRRRRTSPLAYAGMTRRRLAAPSPPPPAHEGMVLDQRGHREMLVRIPSAGGDEPATSWRMVARPCPRGDDPGQFPGLPRLSRVRGG